MPAARWRRYRVRPSFDHPRPIISALDSVPGPASRPRRCAGRLAAAYHASWPRRRSREAGKARLGTGHDVIAHLGRGQVPVARCPRRRRHSQARGCEPIAPFGEQIAGRPRAPSSRARSTPPAHPSTRSSGPAPARTAPGRAGPPRWRCLVRPVRGSHRCRARGPAQGGALGRGLRRGSASAQPGATMRIRADVTAAANPAAVRISGAAASSAGIPPVDVDPGQVDHAAEAGPPSSSGRRALPPAGLVLPCPITGRRLAVACARPRRASRPASRRR
jgi:hypothetical protein